MQTETGDIELLQAEEDTFGDTVSCAGSPVSVRPHFSCISKDFQNSRAVLRSASPCSAVTPSGRKLPVKSSPVMVLKNRQAAR